MTRVATVPAAIRVVATLAGVGLVLAPGHVSPFPVVLIVLGVAAAVVMPRTVGSLPATAAFVVAWLAASNWTVSLPIINTVVGAAALYMLQVSTALAAAVPIAARVEPGLVLGWLRRCARPVLAAAVLIAVDEVIPQQSGTPWIEFGALLGVLALAAVAGYAVRRRSAPAG
jgi:hypothetical protein